MGGSKPAGTNTEGASWAPDRAAGGAALPVMVWIHGGGFVLGSNHAAIQDGTAFARSGVICVAINYRMWVEGFLPIPGVPTNLGLRDILFALRWVKENAAAFGGDAANVTLFGESAGGMAIAYLMTSPLAKGLFRRAIVQSGTYARNAHLEAMSADTATRHTQTLLAALGLTDARQLLDLPMERLIEGTVIASQAGEHAVWRPVAERPDDVIDIGLPFLREAAKAAGIALG